MSDDDVRVNITGAVTGLVASMAEGAGAVREGTEAMSASFEAMSAAIDAALAPLAAITTLLAGGELFKDAIESTTEFAKQLEVGAQKMGITGEELSKLAYAANLSDVSFDQLSSGMKLLARNMEAAGQGGASPAADAFTALGIKVKDAAGNLVPLDDVMLQIATKFATMEDGAGKTALAVNIFGRAGADLIPLLNQGAGGIKALEEQADKLGITMSGTDIDAANKYTDTMKEFHAVMGALEKEIALAVIPTLTKLVTWAEKGAEAMIKLLEKIRMLKPDLTSALDKDPSLDHALGIDQHTKAPPLPTKGGPDQLELWKEQWNKLKETELGGENDLLVMEIFFWQKKLASAQVGSKEYIDVHSHIVDLETQLAKRSADEEAKAAKQVQDEWVHAFEAIPKAWNSAIAQWKQGGESMRDFWSTLMRDLVTEAASASARMIIIHNAEWLEKKKQIIEGHALEIAQSAWSMLKVVADYAAKAAAAAWSALAGIPIVGPALGAAAAAATLAGVLALASGGGGGGGGGGGSGASASSAAASTAPTSVTHVYNINAVDSKSFHEMAMANAPSIAKAAAAGAAQGVGLRTAAGRRSS